MPIRVAVPGHGVVEFPDGTDPSVMEKALSQFATPNAPTAQKPSSGPPTTDVRSRPLLMGLTDAGAARQFSDPSAMNVLNAAKNTMANVGIGLGAGVLGGKVANAVAPGTTQGLARVAGYGGTYYGLKEAGVPPQILDALLVAPAAYEGVRMMTGRIAPAPSGTQAPMGMPRGPESMGGGSRLGNTNAEMDALSRARSSAPGQMVSPPQREALINEMLDALQKPEPPQGVELPPPAELPPGYTPRSTTPTQAPRIVSMRPPPLSPNTRSSWPSGEPPVPQQTSSIQPTANAYINVDKPQPLPSDNPSGWHSGAEDAATKQNMRGAHIDIKHDDANYQGAVADLKATVGPDFLKALLDSLNRGGR